MKINEVVTDIAIRADKIRNQYKKKEAGPKKPASKSILTKPIKR